MSLSAAEANTSTGALPLIWAIRSPDAPKLNATVTFLFRDSNAFPISSKAF